MSDKNNSDDVGNNDDISGIPLVHGPTYKSTQKNKKMLEAVNTVLSKTLSLEQAAEHYKITKKSLQQYINMKDLYVFTLEQEILLKNHFMKCMTLYGMTNNDLRSLVYQYASRLPSCSYPKEWESKRMASMSWFRHFMTRHYELKRLCTKRENTCICTMGCHMGSEGITALKNLEAKILISKVYRYLQREMEYIEKCSDISLLVNILRRTAEATGVCEQTVTSILEEEQKTVNSLFEGMPLTELNGHDNLNQSSVENNEESITTNIFNIKLNSNPIEISERCIISFNNEANADNNTNVTTVEDSSDTEDMKLQIDEKIENDDDKASVVQYTDLQRMQQDSAPIQSVKIEIIEDESDISEQDCLGDDELEQDSVIIGPFPKKARLRSRSEEKELSKNGVIATKTNCFGGENAHIEVEIEPYPFALTQTYSVKEKNIKAENVIKKKETVDLNALQCEEESNLIKDCINNDRINESVSETESEMPITPVIYNSYNDLLKLKSHNKANLISRRTGIAEIKHRMLNVRQEQKFVKWLHRLHKIGFVITENLLINALINIWNDKNKIKYNSAIQPQLYLKDLIKTYPSVAILMKLRHNPNIKTWPSYVSNYLYQKNLIGILKEPSRLFNLEEFGLSMNSTAKNLVIRREYMEESRPIIDFNVMTVVLNVCANGTVAPPMILYPEDHKNNLVPIVPSGWGIDTTNTGWTDGNTMSKYIREHLYPWLLECNANFPIILFMDGSKTISPSLMNFCEKKGIHIIGFPTSARGLLQPLDLGVFASLESTWGNILSIYKKRNNCELNRLDFATRLSVCLDMCATPDTIIGGFEESNINNIH